MGHSWSEWTSLQGKKMNWGLRYQIEALNKMVAHPNNGGENEPMTIHQGCGANTVGVSGGTHGGTGAVDLSAYNSNNRVRCARLIGLPLWFRARIPGVWGPHHHGVTDGDGGVSPQAAAQIKAYHNRRNGLANNGPDTGYRMLVFPLFVFPEKPHGKPGRCWVIKAGKSYEQPTIVSNVKKSLAVGKAFDVIAVVNVDGSYWGINSAAECFPMASLSRTAPFEPPPTTVKKPAHIIDLTNQKVTLPTGPIDDPIEIKQPKLASYSDANFHVNADQTGVVFRAPCNGSHTENSVYSRCEAREMKPGGGDEIAWNSGDGKSHKFQGTLAITEVPNVKPHVVCAQIHDDDGKVIMVRLEGSKLIVEGEDGDELAVLDKNYKLGTFFDLTITANRAGIVVAYYNHSSRVSTMPKVSTKVYSDCYYKNGCYTQASSWVPKTSPKYGTGAGEVVYVRLKITHL